MFCVFAIMHIKLFSQCIIFCANCIHLHTYKVIIFLASTYINYAWYFVSYVYKYPFINSAALNLCMPLKQIENSQTNLKTKQI